MPFRLRIGRLAQLQIDDFSEYLRGYDEGVAAEQTERLNRVLSENIAGAPFIWSYFALTGAPYRAYLFRFGRRTQYWIIYRVNEEAQTVDILRFWNASRDPASLGLPIS
jgi:hypothetical protein